MHLQTLTPIYSVPTDTTITDASFWCNMKAELEFWHITIPVYLPKYSIKLLLSTKLNSA